MTERPGLRILANRTRRALPGLRIVSEGNREAWHRADGPATIRREKRHTRRFRCRARRAP